LKTILKLPSFKESSPPPKKPPLVCGSWNKNYRVWSEK